MSGCRAAPVGSVVGCRDVEWTRQHDYWRGDAGHGKPRIARNDHLIALDALYYARLTALDSAAAACEAIGDARGAAEVRKLKEQQS